MYPRAKSVTILCPLLDLLLCVLIALTNNPGTINALQSDIDCLKSIKNSLEDPLGYLATWDFNNHTEGFIGLFIGVSCWHPDENKVVSISLRDTGLKGPFPRGLGNCSGLTSLDLSGNEIYGTIPSDLSKILPFVTALDLSSNKFSGEIPIDLVNISYLNYIKLDNNQLTGIIPPQFGMLNRIQEFNVANNHLTGLVPQFSNKTTTNFTNNQGLCGAHSLPPCKHDAPKDHNQRDFFIVGFATGWAIFMPIVLYLCLFGFPYTAIKNMLTVKKVQINNTSLCPDEQEDNSNENMIQTLEKFVSRMSFMEIANATSNFCQENVVGCGTLGKVYKAELENGWLLAIKRLHLTENLDEEFASEIVTLGRLRHQNLVPLIGFCCQGKEKLLVYKYMTNGSLHDWLHSTEGKAKALEWPQRMKIAIGVAKALSWLHYSCGLNVVHNGLCSKCILLDHNFEPKISKCWEATILNPSDTASCWNILGKVECGENFNPYTKDVYCFGIVLFELITRKEAYELSCSTEIIFSSSTTSPLEIDGVLRQRGYDDIIAQFLEIAKSCVKFLPNQRPTMLQVYESLSLIAQPFLVNIAGSEISLELIH